LNLIRGLKRHQSRGREQDAGGVQVSLLRNRDAGGCLARHELDRLGEGRVAAEQVERGARQVAFGGRGWRRLAEGFREGGLEVRGVGETRRGRKPCLGDRLEDMNGGRVTERGHWLVSPGKGPNPASRQMASSFCLSSVEARL
jgi:hypothetical protein